MNEMDGPRALACDARYYTDPKMFEAEKAGSWPAPGNSPAMPASWKTRAITWPSTWR
jgi:hypothetical protein